MKSKIFAFCDNQLCLTLVLLLQFLFDYRLKYLHYTVVYLFRLLVLYVAYRVALPYWVSYKDILLEILQ